jgi:hypothetical protein
LEVIGFSNYKGNFSEVGIVELFDVTCSELKEKFFIYDSMNRKEFLEEIEILKRMKQKSCKSQKPIGTMKMIKRSISIRNKPSSNGVANPAVETSPVPKANHSNIPPNKGESSSTPQKATDSPKVSQETPQKIKKSTDVFISYRRSNGSDLASLLKFYLTLKGFKVFFDVDSLGAGHFGNCLIKNVQETRNFILILTPNALDRCIDDQEDKDWVKKEISTALISECNIIPVSRDFDIKVFENEKLPEDIKSLASFNHVIWHHDGQQGCCEKIEK